MTIFKDFKEISMYYMKHGLRIITLHVNGEFTPLQALIYEIPEGPRLNIESVSEQVLEI